MLELGMIALPMVTLIVTKEQERHVKIINVLLVLMIASESDQTVSDAAWMVM